MKRNSMCPICFVKKLLKKPSKITALHTDKPYYNGVALTPPMGWSSWNTFKNHINEDVIYQTAVAMKSQGLLDAGYKYVNIDDCWHSSIRDNNGDIQHDLVSFVNGIPTLVQKINKLGLKVGIYSSNGTLTCEDLPASLGNEVRDAATFARWGVEYFKYDFCHNIPYSRYAPLVYSLGISPQGGKDTAEYNCKQANLEGYALLMPNKNIPDGYVITGLDGNAGAAEFDKIMAEKDGKYTLSVNIAKKGKFDKFLAVRINDKDDYYISVPPQPFWNYTAKFQLEVDLVKGANKIRLYNPIASKADSAMLQYINMGRTIQKAANAEAQKNNTPVKPIVFSICEWGKNEPWKWGRFAGNLWRTTYDIRPFWQWIVIIYNKNVGLHKYSQVGCWNDPDMLEVGNGKLTYNQNVSHFSLWCMMCAPLILGNDIRSMSDELKSIVTNRNLIAINQDPLGKAAKRIIRGKVDVLAKPLADGSVALCLFNKCKKQIDYKLNLNRLVADEYVALKQADSYTLIDQWEDTKIAVSDTYTATIPPHGVKVFKII